MANFKTLWTTGRQDWETPATLFDPLNAEFRFTLDVCATVENAKCARYFTPEQDGLSQQWDGVCWMNPPFRTMVAWIKKAKSESQRNGTTTVCLLPARTNTNWWHDYCMKAEIRYLRGRPKFNGAKHGLPQPLALVIFRGTPEPSLQEKYDNAQLENLKLRKIASHIPGLTYIKAKEASGYGDVVMPNNQAERLADASRSATEKENL